MKKIDKMLEFIRTITDFEPEVGLVLGSGLGDYANQIEESISISYKDIPGFPVSKVEGHGNRFILGYCQGKKVIAMQGRIHYYEGYSQVEVSLPIRLMKKLGIKTLILTNAAGGVNVNFEPGNLMIIEDHINLSGANPLIGENAGDFGPRFPDMSNVYSNVLRTKVIQAAENNEIHLQSGTYLMMSGPNYETPAEIKMIRVLGGDAVGMSTVPEAIVATHCGLDVIGVSCITNMAAGITKNSLNHDEVVEIANEAKSKFTKLLEIILNII